MPTVPQALRQFRASFAALLVAAEAVREAVEVHGALPVSAPVHPEIARVQQIVAAHFGITVEQMLRRSRHYEITMPRQIAMALCLECTGQNDRRIARDFGGFDHHTPVYAADSVARRVETEPRFRAHVEALRAKITAGLSALDSQL